LETLEAKAGAGGPSTCYEETWGIGDP